MKNIRYIFYYIVRATSAYLAMILLMAQAFAAPIKVCYHWLDEANRKILTHKYEHAQKNQGELNFFRSGERGRDAAGKGLYCSSNPYSSSDFGDRVVRIEFVEDTVFIDTDGSFEAYAKKICGLDGKFYANDKDCQSKPFDANLFRRNEGWYVVKNENVIQSWTANSDQLVKELEAAKAHATYSGRAKIESAIAKINAEVKTMGKKVFFNGKARVQLMDILNNPEKLEKYPKISLLSLLADTKNDKLSETKRKVLIQVHMDRALKDSSIGFDEIATAAEAHESLRLALVSRVSKITPQNISQYSSSIVLGAIEQGLVKENDALVTDVVKRLMTADTNTDVILKTFLKLNADSPIRKKFVSLLPPIQKFVNEVNEKSAASMLGILNVVATESTPSVKEYTKIILEKLMKTSDPADFDRLLATITNPSLKKDEAMASIVSELLNPKAKNGKIEVDPLTLASLVQRFSSSLGEEKTSRFNQKIAEMDFVVGSTSSQELLQSYVNRKITVPSNLDATWFLRKVVKLAIKEKEEGREINLFEFLDKNITDAAYQLFSARNHYYYKPQEPHPWIEALYLMIAQDVYTLGHKNLAALALSASSKIYIQSINVNRLEWSFSRYKKGDTQFDSLFENVVTQATDGNLTRYLVLQSAAGSKNSQVARELLEKQVQYLASENFEKDALSSNFKVAQKDIQFYASARKNSKTFIGSICDFWSIIRGLEPELASIISDHSARISVIRYRSEKEFCVGTGS